MKELKKLKGFWKIIFILVAIYVGLGGIMFSYYQSGNGTKEAAGQFGDMFGGITALFGTLTFAGVLYTIILQRRELKLTRREMKLSRLAFEEQNTTTKIQRFENTFFKMIDSLTIAKENVMEWGISDEDTVYNDEAFVVILRKIKGDYQNPIKFTGNNFDEICFAYNDYSINNNIIKINIYYSRFNNLLKLICDTKLTVDECDFYLQILKSNITSDAEMGVLFYYYSLSEDVPDKITEFVKNSGLFNDFDMDNLADLSHSRLLEFRTRK